LHDGLHIDHELEDRGQRLSSPFQFLIERARLRLGARESVQDESLLRIGSLDPIEDHLNDEVIGDVVTSIHDGLCADPQGSLTLDMFTEQVAGGDLRDAQTLAESTSLGPLPGPRGPEQHETHGYLRKPS
jgi:hypothetical protein